jgi:hypothetical protein
MLGAMMKKHDITLPHLPDSMQLHPEGYALGTLEDEEGRRILLIAGVDERGTLYGAGAALRSLTYHEDCISVPNLAIVDKPAFWIRGGEASSTGPRSGAMELGRMRQQTEEEVLEAIEDLVLLGANIFQGRDDLVRPLGLMTYSGNCANALRGFPVEWAATPSNSLHIKVNSYYRKSFVCPSVPEAREALLENYEKTFSEMPPSDFFTTCSGDVAGCTCDKCMPWGETFIHLIQEMADVLHRYQPECRLIATNQNLTNLGDQMILDYLNSEDPSWFYGLRYGPGGNEMSTYNRGPLNPVWFKYPGFGWIGNYLKYVHHQLPREVNVLLFSDITHWIRSQYGVERPDMAFAVIYNRRAWNARPRAYHAVASETFHYCIGDMYYSEGMHDDFNKWFWHRMLWNPNLSAEEITREYCRYWFGHEAEEDMTSAIFLMEENMEKPAIGNMGITRALDLLRMAGEKIPPNIRKVDYRWGIILQKALLDRYIQLRLEVGAEIKDGASRVLERAIASNDPRDLVIEAIGILEEQVDTGEMRDLMKEIEELGEESNRKIGYREPSFANVNDFDVAEIGWWTKMLKCAIEVGDSDTIREAAKMVIAYEDPGNGGFYERVGWPWDWVHLVEHQNITGYFPFPGPARTHHYGLGYSWAGEDTKMTFLYEGLEMGTEYVARICTGFHCEGLEDVVGGEISQQLEANGKIVGNPFPLPLGEIRLFEIEIPGELVTDGRLELVLRSASDEFPAVGLSGLWLMRRDSMPWTTRKLDFV